MPGIVELDHAVTLGVGYRVSEHGRALRVTCALLQRTGKVMPEEYIVAEHQRAGVTADELLANQEGLRQSLYLQYCF